jgi:hypothetical protein
VRPPELLVLSLWCCVFRAAPPQMSALANSTVKLGSSRYPLGRVTLSHGTGALTLSALSSNEAVFPSSGIDLGAATSTDRLLTATPAPAATEGQSALIRLTVTDAAGVSTHQFVKLTASGMGLLWFPCFCSVLTLCALSLPRSLRSERVGGHRRM